MFPYSVHGVYASSLSRNGLTPIASSDSPDGLGLLRASARGLRAEGLACCRLTVSGTIHGEGNLNPAVGVPSFMVCVTLSGSVSLSFGLSSTGTCTAYSSDNGSGSGRNGSGRRCVSAEEIAERAEEIAERAEAEPRCRVGDGGEAAAALSSLVSLRTAEMSALHKGQRGACLAQKRQHGVWPHGRSSASRGSTRQMTHDGLPARAQHTRRTRTAHTWRANA